MTTETKLTRQSPVADLWLAIAKQPGFEGIKKKCPNSWCQKQVGCGCQGRGWVVNQDRDALEQTVRERGWAIAFDQGHAEHGDLVMLWSIVDGKYLDRLATTNNGSKWISDNGVDEGLRGTHAAIVAVADALGLFGDSNAL